MDPTPPTKWRDRYLFPIKLKNFPIIFQNEKALASDVEPAREKLYKNADKYCKSLLGKVSRGHGCLKSVAIIVVALGVGAAVMNPDIQSFDWNSLSAAINSYISFWASHLTQEKAPDGDNFSVVFRLTRAPYMRKSFLLS